VEEQGAAVEAAEAAEWEGAEAACEVVEEVEAEADSPQREHETRSKIREYGYWSRIH